MIMGIPHAGDARPPILLLADESNMVAYLSLQA